MIQSIDLKALRNAEYLQFMGQFAGLVNSSGPAALDVVAQYDSLRLKLTDMEALFKKQLASNITEEIEALDLRRDNAINGITSLVWAYLYHYNPDLVKAASLLSDNLKLYGVGIARENYAAETALINGIIADWENKPQLSQAVTDLDLTAWMAEMKTANNQFDEKYIARTKEYGSANPETLLFKREETTAAYYELRKHIDARFIINEGSALYKNTINELNALIDQYNVLLVTRLATSQGNSETASEG
jgi:Family of unknown function (DUF6261)